MTSIKVRTAQVLLALGSLFCGIGCATFADIAPFNGRGYPENGPHVFGGARLDVGLLGFNAWWIRALALLDLPLSAAADTALLPVSLSLAAYAASQDNRGEDSRASQFDESGYDLDGPVPGDGAGADHGRSGAAGGASMNRRSHSSALR